MGKRAEIMLAYPLEERRLTNPKFGWTYPIIAQPKLDGERCRAILEPGREPILLSSECNQIISVPHILDALRNVSEKVELDGELYAHGLSFSEIHSIVSRQSTETLHDDAWKITYNVFDIVDESAIQAERIVALMNLELEPPIIEMPFYMCNSYEEIMENYFDFLREGYEGIILRHAFKPYVRKRSTFMLKFKPKKTDDYRIVEVIEAVSKNNHPKGMVGAFRCESLDSGDTFKAGAGTLSHEERVAWWKQRDDLIGRYLRIQYQHLTSAGSPRFGLALEVL
jgi:ATP-dependent DNA ligase